ncbi:hypothetical protein [Actinoplanes sp. NPDC051851]|uniref:hypothetical protein n=1 Tax=Actinoplanes sp. NPDC051851 TaxID=3154753 RepID=UPI00343F413B
MTESWRHLPPPARPIAAAASAAVAAVGDADETGLEAAAERLAGLDQAQTGLIMGTTVRLLLEDAHPEGFTADDVREVLKHCVRGRPDADPQVVLWLLAGALGVLDEEGAPAPKPDVLARHTAILLADLLAGRPVAAWLSSALVEIEQSQLND